MARRAKPETRERLSSVATAIRLLKAFSEDEGDIGISDLARRLRIAKSTAHRLAVTLVSEGMVEQDRGTGKYRLGAGPFPLGAPARPPTGAAHAAPAVLCGPPENGKQT